MYQSSYFMNKGTGTFADVLATYGLAVILDEILAQGLGRRESRRYVRIQDVGPYYEVQLDHPLQEEWVENCRFFNEAYYVRTGKSDQQLIPDIEVWDVKEIQRRVNIYKKRRKQLGAESGEVEEPPHNWQVGEFLSRPEMQALKTYNKVVCQWANLKKYFIVNLKTILRMCADPYTDLQSVEDEWKRQIKYSKIKDIESRLTSIQLLNPHQGKGLNEPKANKLQMGNVESFWLQEYLKACGLWVCSAPRTVQKGSSDYKVYVIAPRKITLGAHEKVFERFSKRLWNNTAVKMDCIADLLYTDALLEYSEEGQYDELNFEGYGPEEVITGFHVVQYKPLSRQAYTVTNLAFLGLPTWTGEEKSKERVLELRGIISEHKSVIENIDEGESNGYDLLLCYRNFLSGGSWEDFFEFAVGYSHYIMSQLAQRRIVSLFTAEGLRRLIMATNRPLSEIIDNPGFQNVAYAIRHSTVILQGRKAKNQEVLYEIRYGLGMDLKRKSTVRNDFITALADFMQSYNQENSRVLERSGQQMRKDIRTSDVQEVIKLVDTYGAGIVASLLVAYGYAREDQEKHNSSTM